MKVSELKALLENLPNNMDIYVGCQGYSNYDFKHSNLWNNVNNECDTRVRQINGKLFITDSCALECD